MLVIAILATILAVGTSEAKVYTRCGLTNELLNRGFSRSLVGNWVCMIESESQKDTSKQITKANGSKGLGLFQINSKEWCKYGSPGGKCNIKCENLIDEDIADDSVCARKIQEEKGFRAWDGWVRGCYGRTFPNQIASTCIPTNSGKNLLKHLINEDISDDSSCAKKVEREYGFRAWEGWVRGCYRRNWPLPTC